MPLIFVDDTGLHRASRDDVRSYIVSTLKGIYGGNIDLSAGMLDGQLVDAQVDLLDQAMGVVEQIYGMRSPANATGAALARLARINGVTKKEPAHSTGVVTLTSTPGASDVPVPAGSRIGNNQPDVSATFVTTVNAVIPGAGGTVDVDVRGTTTGALRGNAHELTRILTPIAGWASADNATDVVLGDDGETDAQLRTRRAASVALPSQGILDGLRAALLQLPDVEQCVVRENPEDTTQTLADGGTLAPHAIQIIIHGGADPDAIANAIAFRRTLGCTLVGSITYDVVDVGGTRTMKWDTAIERPIYVTVHTSAPLATDVQDDIAQQIAECGNGKLKINGVPLPGSQIGEDVSVSDVFQAISVVSVTTQLGLKVNEIDIGLTASPTTDTPVPIAFQEIATWDAGNVTFVSP